MFSLDHRKAALRSVLTQICEVIRTTAVSDEFGTTSEVKAVAARYPCRITMYAEGGKGDQPVVGEQTVARTLWRVYLPATAQIDPTDTIRVGGSTDGNSVSATYTVLETTAGRQDAAILCVFARRDR